MDVPHVRVDLDERFLHGRAMCSCGAFSSGGDNEWDRLRWFRTHRSLATLSLLERERTAVDEYLRGTKRPVVDTRPL